MRLSSMNEFNQMILGPGLSDVGFKGSKFTWSNNRSVNSLLCARLDCALVNLTWFETFPDPVLSHINGLSSDHCLILLSHRAPVQVKRAPFKFEAMWLNHSSFLEVFNQAWQIPVSGNPPFILHQKLKALKKCLKKWNVEVFGRLNSNIQAAEEDLFLCQQSFDSNPTDSSANLLISAKAKLHNLLKAEEIHWIQKSRIKWLREGDRNTRFCHISAKTRSKAKQIDCIVENGSTLVDHEQVQQAAVRYFSSLFQASDSSNGNSYL
ncbi:hypothetical protein AAC387_Pa06g0633 [Persea americana]